MENVMDGIVLSVVGLGLVVTKLVDLARNLLDKNNAAPKETWNAVALAFGIAIAFLFNSMGVLVDGQAEHALATGFLIAGASGFWHEGLDFLSGAAKARHAEARAEEATPTKKKGK